MELFVGIVVAVFVLVFFVLTFATLVARLYKKVEQGTAMVVNKTRAIDVTFSGALVVPVIHKAEVMDISVTRHQIARQGPEGLTCRDDLRGDSDVSFYVRANPTNA